MNHQFLWGAATSAHQVEGNNIHNDWWEWERRSSTIEKSGIAADQWNRWREDLRLAKELGHTAHRFSIEWSRIEPSPGRFNRAAVEHYREILKELRALNMKSFVTLHHFTNPLWLTERGGWMSGQTPELFNRYVTYVAQHLGDLVDFWVTVNEPVVYATHAYGRGDWPPQQKGFLKAWWVIRQMAYAHKLAYRAIHRFYPQAEVGVAQSLMDFRPASSSVIDQMIVSLLRQRYNHEFLRLISSQQDFVGVNYYRPAVVGLSLPSLKMKFVDEAPLRSDMGWVVDATGLTAVLLEVRQYEKPIYITENGVADAQDTQRADFIRTHLRAVEEAQRQGADIRGYLYWSLVDNFEWDKGFGPRFGLIAVNYATQERTIRPSAYVYKAIIEQAR